MIGKIAAQYLDPYFVREEELAALISKKSPIPVRRFRYQAGNALYNFRARSKAITVIDTIQIYLYQAVACVGGYTAYVQYDIADNYTRSFMIYADDVSPAGAVNLLYNFGRYGAARVANTTQCEITPLPYTILLPDEQIRFGTTVVADANAATTNMIVYREFDLEE